MRATRKGAVAMMVGFILHGGAAAAEPAQAVEMALPAQPLRDALNGLARQTGLQVIYDARQVSEDITAPRLEGRYTAEGALAALLQGSGLTYEFQDARTVTIVSVTSKGAATSDARGQARAADGQSPLRLAQAASAASSGAAAPSDASLDEVVVTGKIVFTQEDAFGATKMGLALKDTPQTVNVVTSDLMDVATIRTFEDFYKVDASSGTTHALDGYPRNFYRGFYQQGISAVRVDGFRMPGNINMDMAVFDRFEVVKGSTSTLYGQNNVGGALNAVSKLPQREFAAELGMEVAQYDGYRVDADVTGSLAGSEAWSYRLIAAYGDADSFIDYVNESLELASAAVQFAPNEDTRVTLRTTFQEVEGRYHYAPSLQFAGNGTGDTLTRLQSEGLQFIDVPRSRYYGMPWNHDVKQARFIQLQGEHDFSNDWKLRVNAQHSRLERDGKGFYVGGFFDQDGFAYFHWATGDEGQNELYGAEVNLFGDVEILGRPQTLFFGVDYNDIRSDSRGGDTFAFGYGPGMFNAFDPDYGAIPEPLSLDDFDSVGDRGNSNEIYGATVQIITRPTDRLSVLLGGRHSGHRLGEKNRGGGSVAELDAASFSSSTEDYTAFTMQAGVTYEITDTVNAYATYGETFDPQFGNIFVAVDDPGERIDPEEGKSREIGIKADLRPDLFVSAAVFDMERSNLAQEDRLHSDSQYFYVIGLGTQRSRGVELALQGRLMPELSVNASAAYLDAEFSEGELEGLPATNAPRVAVSAFGTYEFLEGRARGLGLGLGVVRKQDFRTFDGWWSLQVEPQNSLVQDFGSFTEVDARVFYTLGHWNLSLSATNLLNEKYYSDTFNQLWWATHVNPPRTWRARATYRF
jgi:iron complex outermembrane receptor protein